MSEFPGSGVVLRALLSDGLSFQVVPWSLPGTSAAAVVGWGHGYADTPCLAGSDRRRPTTHLLETVVAAPVAPVVSIASDLTAGHGPAPATPESTPPPPSPSSGPDCEKARAGSECLDRVSVACRALGGEGPEGRNGWAPPVNDRAHPRCGRATDPPHG